MPINLPDLPKNYNEVHVKIYCGPRAFLADAYFLALSCAFGRTKNLKYASSSRIDTEINYHEKWVRVILRYEASGLNAAASAFFPDNPGEIVSGAQAIRAPVPFQLRGGEYPAFLRKPAAAADAERVNYLPFSDGLTVIANSCGKPTMESNSFDTPSLGTILLDGVGYNYAPHLDGVSRDNDITAVFAAALMSDANSPPQSPTLQAPQKGDSQESTSNQDLMTFVSNYEFLESKSDESIAQGYSSKSRWSRLQAKWFNRTVNGKTHQVIQNYDIDRNVDQ